ncbi:MAG: D-aminoacylase [Acidimicrobiales bacterium]|jgi:N-acyl-D-aspartate/D-glutamate deacylase|nr:D-aminoacylase [Acidimicrobiales bacterium]
MLDYLIRGGTVVDGTGAEGFRADVGIRDGRIVAVGTVTEEAREVVDATGMVVCPGFVDPHTHYDAQILWDPYASPSNLHGFTTVIMGNCGFTLAPIANEVDADYLRKMMAKVEGMPLQALENGVDWNWSSFPEYLERLDGKVGLNVATLVGHTALRRYVMGADAVGNEATPEQIAEMQRLLREAIEAGGMGFSTSLSYTHNDADGKPVPSRWSTRDEVLQLCSVVSEYEGTTLELVTDGCMSGFSDEEIDLMTNMSLAARRPLNWNVLTVDSARPEDYERQLHASAKARLQGARVVALTMPILVGMNMSLGNFCALHMLPDWKDVFSLPIPERIEKLRQHDVRVFLETRAASPEAGVFGRLTGWSSYVIGDTYAPENEGLKGRTVADIARERGVRDFHCLLDICIADDLRTVLWPSPTDDDAESWRLRQAIWEQPDVMIGGSDAGAHLDRMAGAPYPTTWLDDSLRGRKLIALEKAVHLMTDVPARYFGLKDRGRVAEGWYADLVVFDPETVGSDPIEMVDDLPGGTSRLFAGSRGIARVFVNGTPIVADGTSTGELPGALLRSGRDTETNPIPAAFPAP